MKLFVFGLGYSALHFVRQNKHFIPSGTVRSRDAAADLRLEGIEAFAFDGARGEAGLAEALGQADLLLVSAPPSAAGDPVLNVYEPEILASPGLKRVLYLSTVGVYGGADGAWVDERAPVRAASPRGKWRIDAEARWLALGVKRKTPVDVLRLAGIYGPGRSALDKLRDGTARRIVKPGQVFNRVHVDDIAGVLARLIEADGPGGVWNVADREPAPPQDVITFAADLLGVPPPPEEFYETAELSPMARSFYADNRRVSTERLARELGYVWRYPSYREALREMAGADSLLPLAGEGGA
jgi:dTDP-4-dehydrorhamnose reductase